ncbi:hypothetical protein FOTG_06272 [Fusarium oxysporum f. sp. vasinfectum 25433]|uniref:Uncharacterized protein n=1 Tax=Fusarium oxysporum f. sp. vasinfectum 25433 TaxID=1089449 RepID=X0N5U1_FUSOX|nr:hypothetical protein FOTG_06272 [Fusarium oxysporum f. sp. vasinfectum 25433]EXM28030.1 hypothetical protein FOTG_06272 [Fusarium oxysporum f. sp. vasinfectum 25433]
MTETEQRQQRHGRPDDGAKKIECHEDIFWSSISARVSDKDHKNWDRMGKDVHFAYRLGGLCLPFLLFFFFFVFSAYSRFPPCLHSFPSGQLLSFLLFSTVTFYYSWIGPLLWFGLLRGRTNSRGICCCIPVYYFCIGVQDTARLLEED